MNAIPFAVGVGGKRVAIDLHKDHTILAGATRSGKTVTSYCLLAGVARDPLVAVVGVDPSALTLAPFEDAGQELVVTGTADLPAVEAVLAELVAIMDERIARLRRSGVDHLIPSPELPTIRVVLEEYAGLLAAVEAYDAAAKPADRLKPRIAGHVGRLLREGAKAQVLVFTIIQRPDAALIGGGDRAQYARRISHRLDNRDGVRMLNETADDDVIDHLIAAKSGVGLLNEAGEPLRFFRSVWLEYPTYIAEVQKHYRPKSLRIRK